MTEVNVDAIRRARAMLDAAPIPLDGDLWLWCPSCGATTEVRKMPCCEFWRPLCSTPPC